MLRKLAIAIAASGAMMSATSVYALGMGDIELESALNQPLEAHIKLIKAGELEDWEIKPDIASSDEFQKSGIEHIFFLNNLKFEIERSGDDVFIKLSTNQPVVEPFLNFLVQVDWPNGRLLREYTLLLDPPVFAGDAAPEVSAAEIDGDFASDDSGVEAALPGTGGAGIDDLADIPDVEDEFIEEEPVAEEDELATEAQDDVSELPDVEEETLVSSDDEEFESTELVEEEISESEVAGSADQLEQSYTVQSDDTLWEVALRTRANRSISPQQAMLAIQDLNPDAFISGNINRLKKNQVLRVPSEEQMLTRNFKQAVSEVAFQNQFLEQRKAQLDATAKEQVIERSDEVEGGELKLLADGDATSESQRSASGQVMAETQGTQSKLDNDLSLALENLDKSTRENSELSSRLDSLEEQIKTLQRIINLKDEQMLALQAGFSGEESVSDQSMTARQAELDDLASNAVDNQEDLNFESVQEPIKTVEEVQPKPKSEIVKIEEPVDEPFDAVAFALDNPPLLGGVLGGLLLTLLGVNYARKRKEKQNEEADISGFDGQDPLDQVDSQLGGDFADEFSDLEIDSSDDLAAEELDAGSFDADDFESAETGLPDDLEEGDHEGADVLGEAEIYMAYDRMDQARTLLEKTLLDQPGRMDVRLKLLEVLSSTDDKAEFSQHYDYVVAQGDDDEQAKAAQFRDALGLDDSLAGQGISLENDMQSPSSSDDLENSGLDFGGSENEFTGLDIESNESELNFDLDGLDLLDEAPTADQILDLTDSDNGLDFEAQLGDDALTDSSIDELDLDLDLGLASGSNDLEFDLDLNSGLSESAETGLESNLDLDTSEQSAELSFESDLGVDLDTDLSSLDEVSSLELDSGLTNEDTLNDLSLELDQEEGLNLESDTELPILDDADEISIDTFASSGDALDELSADMGLDLDLGSDLTEEVDVELPVLEESSGVADNLSVNELSLDLDIGADSVSSEETLEDLDSLSSKLDNTSNELPTLDDSDLAMDDLDSDLDFLSGTDESETKLDLARAYIDMDDQDGAKEILQEVIDDGSDEQKKEAGKLMDSLV